MSYNGYEKIDNDAEFWRTAQSPRLEPDFDPFGV